MQPTIIITGASRGLGAATARIAAGLGANVVLNARAADDLARVAQAIRDAGGTALAIAGDVSRAADCEKLVATAVSEFGRVDAVVNNAGILEPLARLADADPDAWRQNWAVNVLGPLLVTQAALPYLRAVHGRVINVSSGAAVKAYAGWGAYCVAKGALNQFNQVLAMEEARLTAIAFRPGVVDTAMQSAIRETGADAMTDELHAQFMRLHAGGELLPPETPGRALAVLALYADSAWSGEFLQWDDERVQALVARHAPEEK